jgi:hypothetical protein
MGFLCCHAKSFGLRRHGRLRDVGILMGGFGRHGRKFVLHDLFLNHAAREALIDKKVQPLPESMSRPEESHR